MEANLSREKKHPSLTGCQHMKYEHTTGQLETRKDGT